MTAELKSIVAAFAFLTRFPVPGAATVRSEDLVRSPLWFPLVGFVVGSAAAVSFALFSLVWPATLALVLSTVITVRLTGAFHEDALADSLDGFGGGWNRDQTLTIMKDSRVGSYALVGMILAMLIKIFALQTIFAVPDGAIWSPAWRVAAALLSAHTIARASSVWLMATVSYVDRNSNAAAGEIRASAGGPFSNRVPLMRALGATLIAAAVVIPSVGLRSIGVFAVAILVTAVAARFFTRRIGGLTGDAIGAANQCVELCVYLALAARPS